MSTWFYNSFEDRSSLNASLGDILTKNGCAFTPSSSYAALTRPSKRTPSSEVYRPNSVFLRSNQKRTLSQNSNSPNMIRSVLKKQKIQNMGFSFGDSPIQYHNSKKGVNSKSIKSHHQRRSIIRKKIGSNSCFEHIEEADLAVHPKKIEELTKWFREKMLIERGHKALLLTGPCGCGKTATVKAICLELGIEILEFDGNQEYEFNYKGDEVWEKSAMEIFSQFLRNSQFGSIETMSLKHRLLLIEPLPNMFYRKPQLLSQILNKYVLNSRCIIVFIMSNIESCWELSPIRLFPETVLSEFQIDHIKFNSVATSFMNKAIKRAFQIFGIRSVENDVVKEIAASSNGDIRKALNIIEFRVNGKKVHSSSATAAVKLKLLTNQVPEHYDIYQYIGKIMYAKRLPTENEEWTNSERILLPKARKKFTRPFPPKENLNELVDVNSISGSMLISYIFEHEPNFAPSISALASLTAHISIFDAHFQTTNMDTNHIKEKYLTELGIRSTIFHNYSLEPRTTTNRRGLYQFSKPTFKGIEEKRKEQRQKMVLQGPLSRHKDFFYMKF